MNNEEEKLEVNIDIYRFLKAYNQKDFWEKAVIEALMKSSHLREAVSKEVIQKIIETEAYNKIQTNVHVSVDKYFSQTDLKDDYNFKNYISQLIRQCVNEQEEKVRGVVEKSLKDKGLDDAVKKQIEAEIKDRVGELFGRYRDDSY